MFKVLAGAIWMIIGTAASYWGSSETREIAIMSILAGSILLAFGIDEICHD